ncbi:MAG: ABC transporter ATP-binding protein [Thermoprotei archaeon]|nr:ABC transporter ATP-binding protein [Thermoprotei archaeon]
MCRVLVENQTVTLDGKDVLRDVNLDVEGGITAIIGPNGAGKTTLLKSIAGIVAPSKGRVLVCGLEAREASRMIAYVPAYLMVDPHAKVEDVIEAYLHGVRGVDVESVLKSSGLERFRGRKFNTLSGGEHKLVLIAGAIARNPKLLLLDEPFSHLDLANQVKLAKILRGERGEGRTIIMTAHEPLHASIADRVALMNSGSIMAYGKPEDVVRRELLEKVYGVELLEITVEGGRALIPRF